MQTEDRKKILIVDDDPMVLKVIRSYLKDIYKVYCLRSGEEALKFLSMQIPDVRNQPVFQIGQHGIHVLPAGVFCLMTRSSQAPRSRSVFP